MNTLARTIIFIGLLSVFACGRESFMVSPEALQDAQNHYDSGFVMLQQDSLLAAFPHFFEVANRLEKLPEDMTNEEMLLASKAYYQMANVFGAKMEHNAEIDALHQALGFQTAIHDTTWMIRSSLQLASALEIIQENDSASFYLNRVMPLLDTVSDDVEDYTRARYLLACLYFDKGEVDSCVMVQKQLIDFKARRGMDTKNDSVNIGINLFFADFHAEAKPYLLKMRESDFDDVKRGAIMSLLGQIYEEENKPDSAALFHSFNPTYVEAESERVSDGMLAVKQYEQFKAERDARLQALREQKEARAAQVKNFVFGGLALLLVLLVVAYVFVLRKRHYTALKDKDFEALNLRVKSVYDDKLGNKMERITKVFVAAYPDALAKLKAAYPDLNQTEYDVCVLSMFPFRTKEIADILDLRENTVSKYRTNIKKKTQADSFEALWERFIG